MKVKNKPVARPSASTASIQHCGMPEADPPSSAMRDEPLYRVFKQVGLAFRQRALQLMRDEGIDDVNPGATPLLLHLGDEDGLTLGELARRCGLENSTLTPLVTDLESAQLVARARAPEDRRVSRLYLTASGRTRERQLRALMFQVQQQALSGISDNELAMLHQTLDQICTNLQSG